MTNRTNKAVEEFYSSSTIAPLLNIKAEDVQNFCYQHKIKTKVHDNGNESKLFVSSKSLQDYLARSKVSDQANIALKWQALKQSIDSKNNKRIDRKPKEKQELPTCSEMPEGFVDKKEAARILGVMKSYINQLCRKGKLDAKKIKSRGSGGFKYAVSISSCEDYKSNKYKEEEMPEGFVDVTEAAQMLEVHRDSILHYIYRGELDAKKIKSRSCYGYKYVVTIRSCEDYKSKYKNYSEEIPEGFVDKKEAARILGVTKLYINQLCKKGKLEGKKIRNRSSGPCFTYAVSISSCEDYKSKYRKMPEGFVGVYEAARMLGMHENSILRYIYRGELDAKKIKSQNSYRGFKYAVSISSCEDLMEARKNIFKKNEELIEKRRKGDISVDAAYQKIKTNKEDKMNQDNNSKLPSIDLYQMSHIIDLNTLALVYPNLRDWLAESRNTTIREFIVDTIKQIDHLQKIANMENKNVITK